MVNFPLAIVSRSLDYYCQKLPQATESPNDVFVNGDGHRLDPYCPKPSLSDEQEYRKLKKTRQQCNSYHLSGECVNSKCTYCHDPVSDTITSVLRYYALKKPCEKGGNCRSFKCYKGHICQKPYCKRIHCGFDDKAHTLDLSIREQILSIKQNGDEDSQSVSIECFDSASAESC